MPPEVGLTATLSLTVSDDDTAVALGSGTVPVLGTPRVVALCEEATVAAISSSLGDGQTTVGSKISLEHLAPTPVGGVVEASAVLEKVEGRRLTFTVKVSDERSLLAAGRIVRIAVDEDTFVARAQGDG
ncbi:MAG: hotdog domain-containing protein [Actinomycetota bacterium]